MRIGENLLAVSLCGFLTCCGPYIADIENANKSTPPDKLATQFGHQRLLEQLKREQGIETPFAWEPWGGTKEKGGTIIGIDQEGMLRRVEFIQTADQYVVKLSNYTHKLNVPIRRSGDLELRNYLPDSEFPFKSFIVSAGGCAVHFVLLWESLNRSFDQRSVFLDAIQLRLIVEKDGTVVSNRLEKLFFDTIDQTVTEDVNKDGKPDFLVIGSNMSTFVRIWTVEESCAVMPLLFKEGDHLLDSVRDKGLSLRKNKLNGAYDIHVTHYEPITKNGQVYSEITETLYRWDPVESVYKVIHTQTRLESS